ncbi:hypothetical protein FOS14_00210 [Skermania sp. ID1734]|uniref:hypothetical protein n=1 Tax=Skermania sp. ID1734 TaxID=2597516 RepID=UPI00117DC6CC|nr:hypothetical protein [Skermania sp. ID1734]TSE01860.1 hypothetical protein FOS14_00210 [Skermania sp. ID1734]
MITAQRLGAAVAIGAITVGVLAAASGCGSDTPDYTPPPPLPEGSVNASSSTTETTFSKVTVPPSPSWQMAPDNDTPDTASNAPEYTTRAPFSFVPPTSTTPDTTAERPAGPTPPWKTY